MSKCPDCGTEMKPLAYSEFCPNDCDRKPPKCPAFTPNGFAPCTRGSNHDGPCAHPFAGDLDFEKEESTPPYYGIPRPPGHIAIDPDDIEFIEKYIDKLFSTD